MMMFTCTHCDTKQSKFFTKSAYHEGVVLVKCEGCGRVHLIADNLGWYGDEKTNVEKMMNDKNEKVVIGHADSQLLDILQSKVKATQARFDEQQKQRREVEEAEEAAEKAAEAAENQKGQPEDKK